MTFFGLMERPSFFHGYINGFTQPSALIKCQVVEFHVDNLKHLHRELNNFFSEYHIMFDAIESEQQLVESAGKIICALHKLCSMPVFHEIKINLVSAQENVFHLWVPTFDENHFHRIMAYAMQFMMQYISPNIVQPKKTLNEELRELISTIKKQVLVVSNNVNFIAAAHKENIPWRYFSGNTFQYGWGEHSRLLQSTLTDKTSKIASELANNKIDTSQLLKRMGLPVPEQKIASTEDECIQHAQAIGYPVVIKPYNQERGKGVSVRLLSEQEVKTAFHHAKKYSDVVLVEKHIEGRNYRLVVSHGKLIWAIERVPVDDSGIINIAGGAKPVAVFDKVHPDNKRLMETAANLLRLDFAGIDFIIRDISESFYATNSAILEINAGPQLGLVTAAHIYHELLLEILPNKGRIPVIVVCSQQTDEKFLQELTECLATQYKNIGMVKNNRAFINNEMINESKTAYCAGDILLCNKIDILVYCSNSSENISDQELPFDRYDHLIILDSMQDKHLIISQFKKFMENENPDRSRANRIAAV